MADYPGLDPDGKDPGGIEVAGNVEAASQSIAGVTQIPVPFPGGGLRVTDNNADLSADNVADYGIQTDSDGGLIVRHRNNDTYASTLDVDASYSGAVYQIRRWNAGSSQWDQIFTVAIDTSDTTVNDITVHGNLFIVGKLETGATIAHVLGAYSGKSLPIYSDNNTLIGYIPIYA